MSGMTKVPESFSLMILMMVLVVFKVAMGNRLGEKPWIMDTFQILGILLGVVTTYGSLQVSLALLMQLAA